MTTIVDPSTMPRPSLNALSDAVGILPSYIDVRGRVCHAEDSTREAILASLGLDVSTEEATERSLQREHERRHCVLSPTRVGLSGEIRSLTIDGEALAAEGLVGGEWHAVVELESGERVGSSGRLPQEVTGNISLPLGGVLPLGYHDVSLRLAGRAGASQRERQRLIVVPRACPDPATRLRGSRGVGILANLYTVRSDRSWGHGDLTDLGELVDWAGDLGVAFVGTNPLHAVTNRPGGIGPYSPVSRLFRNVLYIDVRKVPELDWTPTVREVVGSPAFRAELRQLRASDFIEHERVLAAKTAVLRQLHREFSSRHRDAETRRGRDYRRYVESQGQALDDFATFCALQDELAEDDWRRWPPAYHDADGTAVRSFRRRHVEPVDFHRYLQFEADRQLGRVAARAKRLLPIGLYQDLALGSAPGGCDTWANRERFVHDVSLGAPRDPFAPQGQNWGLPPLDPRRLKEDGYEEWIRLVRAALAHTGALRLDHVMGLFRQYWIPSGFPATDGAYVRFPAADLLGILALESSRAGAIVIGEDLGTVPAEVPGELRRWGILSTRVLYFERDPERGFRPASSYPENAMVAVDTHDLVPLAGFCRGRDIVLRHESGLSTGTDALATRERERSQLVERLVTDGALTSAISNPTEDEICAAAHRFLCKTPSRLVGISLDDLAAETEPVNLPGASPQSYPSWSRRMGLSLRAMRQSPSVRSRLGDLAARPETPA